MNRSIESRKPGTLRGIKAPKVYVAVAMAAVMAGGTGFARADVLGTWNISGLNTGATGVSGSLTPSVTGTNVNTGPLLLGGGVTANSTAKSFGGNNWDGTTNSADAANAGDYISFTVTASSGFSESFSSISAYNLRRSGTGPTTALWQYQVGLGSFTDIGASFTVGSVTSSTGNPQSAVTLSSITALQIVNPGVPVTFRLVAWGDTNSGGTLNFNAQTSANNLVINGNTAVSSALSTTYNWIGSDIALGGSGTWDASTSSSWTGSTATIAATTWDPTKLALFDTAAGTVSVVGNVNVSGNMQFSFDGYSLTNGGSANLNFIGPDASTNVITVDNAVTATIGVTLSGAAGFTKAGGGTLVLTQTATNLLATTFAIQAGVLQLGNGATSGAVSGDVSIVAGSLVFNRSDSTTFSGNISGLGSTAVIGSGKLTLVGNDSHTGGTSIAAGSVLQVGNGSTVGNLSGSGTSATVTDNGALIFNHADGVVFSSLISGSGTLAHIGGGNLTLMKNATMTGGTSIANGATLSVGDGTVNVTLAGAIVVDGSIVFKPSFSTTVAGNISGNGSLSNFSAGTTTLTGDATHLGGTTVSVGSMQIGNGGTSGTLSGNVTINSTLIFNRSDASTFAGVFNGGGALNKLGAGSLTVSGASPAYTGTTTIAGGGVVKVTSNSGLGVGGVSIGGGSVLAGAGSTLANAITINVDPNSLLLAFWNFDNASGSLGSFNTTGTTEVYNATTKQLTTASAGSKAATAIVDLSDLAGTMGGTANNNWGTFGGTTINQVVGGSSNSALAVVGSGNNNSFITFEVSTSGYKHLITTYASQATSTGFTDQSWSYSTDGTTFISAGSLGSAPSSFGLETLDLSSITMLDNQPNVFLRLTLNGATNSSGNNRIDNVQFNAVTPGSIGGSIGSDVAGSSTFSGNIGLNASLGVTSAAGGVVTVTGTISDISGTNGVVKNGPGTVVLAPIFASTYGGGTTVNAGTLLIATPMLPTTATSGPSAVLNGGTLAIAPTGTAHVTALSAPATFFSLAGGKISLSNNDMYLAGGATQATAFGMAQVVPRALGVGQPIVTTGVITGADYLALRGPTVTAFDGITVASDSLLLRYGYAGDANEDGKITIDDYLLIDYGYAHAATDYTHGDFNHDGVVNASDYALIDYNAGFTGFLAAGEIALHTAEFGSAYTDAFNSLVSAVPEPTSLALLGLGAVGMLKRRRR